MRRFFAFIVMVVSILAAIIFNTQAVMDKRVLSLEYGGGRELVYSLTKREEGDRIDPESIGANILNRLDLAGIKNAEIEVVGDTQMRVTLATHTTGDYDNARTLIEGGGTLTVCTASEYCISQNRFFRDTIATVYYNGLLGYPGLNIKNNEMYNELMTHLSEVGIEGQENNAYVWVNKTDTDTYENAYGEDPDEDVLNKVLAVVDMSNNYNLSVNAMILDTKKDGTSFDTSSARAWVNARNSEDYGVDLTYLYENNVSASLGNSAMNNVLIAVGVAILLIAILLCLFYGFSGLISVVSISGGLLVDILIFSFLGFEFSPAALIGVLVTLALGVYISINYFERVKSELQKGKSIAKANQEGYRKSFIATLDSCAVLFVISLVGFLAGVGTIKTFCGVTLIGSLAILLITNFLSKWMMYWLTTSEKYSKNNGGFGLNVKIKKDSAKAEDKTPFTNKKSMMKGLITAGACLVLALGSLLGFGLSGNLYNNSDAYLTNGRIDIETTAETYLDRQSFVQALEDSGYEIEYEDMTFNRIEMYDEYDEEYYTTYISLKTDRVITDDTIVNGLTSMFVDEDEDAIVTFSRAYPSGINHNTNSFYLILGLSCLFISLYVLIRYGISMMAAYLATTITTSLFAITVAVLFRLPFNLFTGFGYLGAAFVVSFLAIALFARYKDIIKDSKIKKPTMDQRGEMLNEAMKVSLPTIIGTVVAASVLCVVTAAFTGAQLVSTFTVMLLTIALGGFLTVYLVCPLYMVIRRHLKFKVSKRLVKVKDNVSEWFKKHIKHRKKPVLDANEPHETIVPGINDFR